MGLEKTSLSIDLEDITSFKGGHVHGVAHRTVPVEAGEHGGKSWAWWSRSRARVKSDSLI